MSEHYSFGRRIEEDDKSNPSKKASRFKKTIKREKDVLLPKKGFTTLRELMKFYDGLIRYCLFYELRRESIEGAIARMKEWTKKTVPMLKESRIPAQMQLEEINNLLEFERGRLEVVKEEIGLIYNTNELIINTLIRVDEKTYAELQKEHQGSHPDLLHGGGKGWMFEYDVYLELRKKGRIAFLTFGTPLEPGGVDVVSFEAPLDRKFELFTPLKKPKG